MTDSLCTLDDGSVSVLTRLDLSAAFEMTDLTILLERLENLYGISGTDLSWFGSYVPGRTGLRQ